MGIFTIESGWIVDGYSRDAPKDLRDYMGMIAQCLRGHRGVWIQFHCPCDELQHDGLFDGNMRSIQCRNCGIRFPVKQWNEQCLGKYPQTPCVNSLSAKQRALLDWEAQIRRKDARLQFLQRYGWRVDARKRKLFSPADAHEP